MLRFSFSIMTEPALGLELHVPLASKTNPTRMYHSRLRKRVCPFSKIGFLLFYFVFVCFCFVFKKKKRRTARDTQRKETNNDKKGSSHQRRIYDS